MSTEDKNKAAKRRYIEAFNARNLAVFNELFAADYVAHVPGFPEVRGPQALKDVVGGTLVALPDAQITIEDMLADEDKVVTRWTLRGTQHGEFMGVAPTRKEVIVTGIIVDRFVNGKVVEAWENLDLHGLMQQLGAIPSPE